MVAYVFFDEENYSFEMMNYKYITLMLILGNINLSFGQGNMDVKKLRYNSQTSFFVLDVELFNTVYAKHIELFKNNEQEKIFTLLNDMALELLDMNEDYKKTPYYFFMSSYDYEHTDSNCELAAIDNYEKISYVKSAINLPQWREDKKFWYFIATLLFRDCLAVFRENWYLYPRVPMSKDLLEYVFTDEEITYLFLLSKHKFHSMEFSHGLLTDLITYQNYEAFVPYFVIDRETIKEINEKFERQPKPYDELLQKEYLFYKKIFQKANDGKYIILVQSWD